MMDQLGVAHYRSGKIILLYLVMTVILVGGIMAGDDVTYTTFLTYPPGIYFLYFCFTFVAWLMILRLPYFFRALFRIPALEYDVHILVIRGWDTHSISSEDLPNTVVTYGTGPTLNLAAPKLDKPIIIDLRFVWEVPTKTLLERLTMQPIGPFVERAHPVMTDEQKASHLKRKAAGYFLLGIGLPIAAAFIYPFIPSRRSGPLIDSQSLSTSDGYVFLIGAGVGLLMSLAGYLVLKAGDRH